MAVDTAEVVIVGAGIVGLSIAHQLAIRSPWRVVALEKGAGLGEGSTGASSACLRRRYTQDETVRLAGDGLAAFRHWSEFTQLAEPRTAYVRTGVLWMTGESPAEADVEADRLRRLGVETTVLDPGSLRRRFPDLSTCGSPYDRRHDCTDQPAFLFEEEGGYVDPVAALEDLAEACRRDGVEVRFRSPVVGVERNATGVRGVVVGDGSQIHAPVVVNAAGPWCSRVSAMAEVELPWDLRPVRVQVIHRPRPPEVAGPLPMVADTGSGIYLRPDGGGRRLLLGSVRAEDEREEVEDPDLLRRQVDRSFLEERIHGLHHRIPALPYRGRLGGLAGLYTVNRQDVHPVVGPVGPEGFWVANGFSGHGFKLAPAVGAMVARALTGEGGSFDTEVSPSYLSVDRSPLEVRSKSVLA